MDLVSTTASQWQELLSTGKSSSRKLVEQCLEQVERHNHNGMYLNAVIKTIPRDTAFRYAAQLDQERALGQLRSPLHGIPIIIKDIFPTEPHLGMPTSGGAVALSSAMGRHNCLLVDRLLCAGLIVIAKSNLTEFCGLKTRMPIGWSALGGQTQSPYIAGGIAKDEAICGNTKIGGSSSGSAASVAAGFAPLAIGTDTSGSLVIPANRGGLWSLKVTPTNSPKQDAFCLSSTLDSMGGMAKSATDLRLLTRIITGSGMQTKDFSESLQGFRIGFVDPRKWRLPDIYCPLSIELRDELDEKYNEIMAIFEKHGAKIVANVSLPDTDDLTIDGESVIHTIAFAEFRSCFRNFATALTSPIQSLDELIEYNEQHPQETMPPPCTAQEELIAARDNITTLQRVQEAIDHGLSVSKYQGIDKAMKDNDVELIIAPADSVVYCHATCAGYPIGTIPFGSVKFGQEEERPDGLCIIAKADADERILDFMVACEKVLPKRLVPSMKTSS